MIANQNNFSDYLIIFLPGWILCSSRQTARHLARPLVLYNPHVLRLLCEVGLLCRSFCQSTHLRCCERCLSSWCCFCDCAFLHTRTHGVLFLQSFGSRRIIFGAAFLCAASPCPQMFSVFAVVFVAHIFSSFLLPFCFPGVRGWCAGQTIPNAPLRPAVLEGRLCSCWCNAHRLSTSKSCFTAFGVAA